MPWTARYVADGAYVTFTGDTTGDDLVRANTEFYEHVYESGPRFAVFDFSGVERFDVDAAAVKRVIAQDLIAAAAAVRDLAVAVVAADDGVYYPARIWELAVEGTAWRTKIVHARESALDWLREQGIPADRLGAFPD